MGILIVGMVNYNNKNSVNNNDTFNAIGGMIFISFLWPFVMMLAIGSFVVMVPIWIIYQVGKLIGKLVFKQEN